MKTRHLIMLVVMMLALSSCATLPTAGQPQAFDVDVPTPSAVDFVAGAPTKGASPQTLIEGFLRACSAGASDNFNTARLFLSRETAQLWEPTETIHIYATDATPQISVDAQEAQPQVSVSAPAVAAVDNAGILRESPSGTLIHQRFALTKEDGEWRIIAPDNGIIISAASFNATYQLSHVFFPTATGQSFVSEAQWFARKHLAQQLVESLLAGPSEQLQPIVEPAIPSDMRLASGGVDVIDGQATVRLDGTVPQDKTVTDVMLRQISQTIRQSAQVREVVVYVNGQRVEASADIPPAPLPIDSAFAMAASGMGMVTNGQFVALEGNAPFSSAPAGPGGASLSARWEADLRPTPEDLLAMHPTNPAEVAWVGDGQLTVVDRDSGRTYRVGALQASWPSIDRYGWVWSVSHGGGVRVVNIGGQTAPVADSVAAANLVNIRISPDGNRAVVVRRVGNDEGAWVALVRRDRQGVPQNLAHLVPLARVNENVRDVSWVSSNVVAVLHGGHGSGASVVTIPLGGMSQSVQAPDNARFLTAGGSASSVYVTDERGQVWLRTNALWQPLEDEVVSLRFPG